MEILLYKIIIKNIKFIAQTFKGVNSFCDAIQISIENFYYIGNIFQTVFTCGVSQKLLRTPGLADFHRRTVVLGHKMLLLQHSTAILKRLQIAGFIQKDGNWVPHE